MYFFLLIVIILSQFDKTYYWTDWYNKTVYQAYPTSAGISQAAVVRRSLIGALDIRAVSAKRQVQELNQCAQDNGGCTHLCLYLGYDYICACPDQSDGRDCKLIPKSIVPRGLSDATEYLDEGNDIGNHNINNDESDDNDYDTSDAASREAFVIIASGVVTVMLILIIVAILRKFQSNIF